MTRYLVLTALIFTMGCRTWPHPKQTHVYTDTPQGRTAQYVHKNCDSGTYFPARSIWDPYKGEMELVPGHTLYGCPEYEWLTIEDGEEQP